MERKEIERERRKEEKDDILLRTRSTVNQDMNLILDFWLQKCGKAMPARQATWSLVLHYATQTNLASRLQVRPMLVKAVMVPLTATVPTVSVQIFISQGFTLSEEP